MILNKQRYLMKGYRFLSNNMNKEGMEKLGPQIFFFSVKNIGSWLEIKKKLLGGNNILLKFVFNDTPMQIINAMLIGVALLVYDNTAVIQFLIIKYGGQINIAKVRLELANPLFQSMVTL